MADAAVTTNTVGSVAQTQSTTQSSSKKKSKNKKKSTTTNVTTATESSSTTTTTTQQNGIAATPAAVNAASTLKHLDKNKAISNGAVVSELFEQLHIVNKQPISNGHATATVCCNGKQQQQQQNKTQDIKDQESEADVVHNVVVDVIKPAHVINKSSHSHHHHNNNNNNNSKQEHAAVPTNAIGKLKGKSKQKYAQQQQQQEPQQHHHQHQQPKEQHCHANNCNTTNTREQVRVEDALEENDELVMMTEQQCNAAAASTQLSNGHHATTTAEVTEVLLEQTKMSLISTGAIPKSSNKSTAKTKSLSSSTSTTSTNRDVIECEPTTFTAEALLALSQLTTTNEQTTVTTATATTTTTTSTTKMTTTTTATTPITTESSKKDATALEVDAALNDIITAAAPLAPDVHIEYTEYEAEHQMHDIMRLIQAELSEPYSIYTYRYFIYNWPKLCFLARHGNDYVGAIVCKLDMHMNVRRGYIAMLAVRKEYRKLKIGTTLVQKAIEAMLADNADEVVLETEMRNIPALRLYENLGFVRDKRLFRYYLNGVDALRLKLWFR